MALINCPKCGKSISEKAQKCPKCGWKVGESVEESSTKSQRNEMSRKVKKSILLFNHRKKVGIAVIVIFILLAICIWGLAWQNYKLSAQQNSDIPDINEISQETGRETIDENTNFENEELKTSEESVYNNFETHNSVQDVAEENEIKTEDNSGEGVEIAEFSGNGDTVLKDINIPKGVYRIYMESDGDRNFAIWAYGDSTKELWVNKIGQYTGYTVLTQEITNGMIEVQASGNWLIRILPIENNGTSNLCGNGDGVSPYFYLDQGLLSVKLKNSGKENFAVQLYGEDGKYYALLANEIGSYEGEKVFDNKQENMRYFLRIRSDGEWSVDFNIDDTITQVSN